MEKKRSGGIDFLRIVAATLIVVHHYQQGTNIQFRNISFYGGTFNFGYIVELFFIISGLLTCKYISRITINTHLWDFFGGKVKRLVPLLAISVVVEAILRWISDVLINGIEFSRNLVDIVTNMLGIQSLGMIPNNAINQPTWYLSVLLMCFVWFFILTYLAKRLNINEKYLYLGMIILGIVINTYSLEFVFLNRNLARGYFSFFLGVLLGDWIKKIKRNYMFVFFPIIFLLLLKYKQNFVASGDFYIYSIMMWVPVIIIMGKVGENKILEKNWISTLGKISFSVYLWNEPLSVVRNIIATIIPSVNLCRLSSLIVFVFLNWILGILSFYLLEKNIEKFIRKKHC